MIINKGTLRPQLNYRVAQPVFIKRETYIPGVKGPFVKQMPVT